jgi:hypothetical protein
MPLAATTFPDWLKRAVVTVHIEKAGQMISLQFNVKEQY